MDLLVWSGNVCAFLPDGGWGHCRFVAWNLRLVWLLELEPVIGDFANRRAAQKAKFGCEFFPSSFAADSVGSTFLEFFQIDKETGNEKGIVALDL